jgi:uncharacterized repeat protein (TIGR01451 family)
MPQVNYRCTNTASQSGGRMRGGGLSLNKSILSWAWLLLACMGLLLGSGEALAQTNLVTNPFFVGTTPAGWTVSGTTGAPGYTNFGAALRGTVPAAITAAGGTTAMDSGCVFNATSSQCLNFSNTATATLSPTASAAQQAIATTVGEGYYLVFWTYFSGVATGTNIQTDAYWGSTRVFTTNPAVAGWTQRIINLGVATTSSTTLTFLTRDDPAFSQVTYAQVYAYPKLTVSKTGPSNVTVTQPYTYTLTISNSSAGVTATGVTVADLVSAGATLGSVSCSATSTAPWVAACPGSLSFPIAAFDLAPSSTLTLTVSATVNASTTGTVTNNATLTSTLRSTITSALSASHTATITAPANLSVSKTNSVTTVLAGSTTQYQITVSNAGPAWASLAVVKDAPSSGLNCSTLTCAAGGGASCPGSLPVATFTASGLAIPIFPAGSSVTFLLTCSVVATGT